VTASPSNSAEHPRQADHHALDPGRSADGVSGTQAEAVVESIGVAIGDNPLAVNASRQFRQVMLSVPDASQQLPIGLKVAVQFSPCLPGEGAPRR
jgi:hypothetical protein